MARITSLNISRTKGVTKEPVQQVQVVVGYGFEGDAHGGDWHRQVSLLAEESIQWMRQKGGKDLVAGSFAENITVQGLALASLPVGTRLVSGEVELEITQIGKECHKGCAIRQQVGDCIMPREGIFARVITGGELRVGQSIDVKTAAR
jgi:MOSC domain-containing protein YiiM